MSDPKLKRLLALLAALSVSSSVAVAATTAAAGPKAGPRDMPVGITAENFEQADVNNDGIISEAEYMRFMEGVFNRLDADGNGSLTMEEVNRLLTPAQFQAADANNDGRLTLDELIEELMRDFRQNERR